MKFNLEIDMDNAAFEDNLNELSNIFTRLSKRVKDNQLEPDAGYIRDSNGNKVGDWHKE